jgi:hypothetical protein
MKQTMSVIIIETHTSMIKLCAESQHCHKF